MSDRRPPELDLLPDGSYRPRRPPVAARIFAWAMVIAVVAGALAVAAFALWFALILIPVMVVAGADRVAGVSLPALARPAAGLAA